MKIGPDDPKLTAFILGELEESEREEIQAELEKSSELKKIAEELRETALFLGEEIKKEALFSLREEQKQEIIKIGTERQKKRTESFLSRSTETPLLLKGFTSKHQAKNRALRLLILMATTFFAGSYWLPIICGLMSHPSHAFYALNYFNSLLGMMLCLSPFVAIPFSTVALLRKEKVVGIVSLGLAFSVIIGGYI